MRSWSSTTDTRTEHPSSSRTGTTRTSLRPLGRRSRITRVHLGPPSCAQRIERAPDAADMNGLLRSWMRGRTTPGDDARRTRTANRPNQRSTTLGGLAPGTHRPGTGARAAAPCTERHPWPNEMPHPRGRPLRQAPVHPSLDADLLATGQVRVDVRIATGDERPVEHDQIVPRRRVQHRPPRRNNDHSM